MWWECSFSLNMLLEKEMVTSSSSRSPEAVWAARRQPCRAIQAGCRLRDTVFMRRDELSRGWS
jgi:hypothetical protein